MVTTCRRGPRRAEVTDVEVTKVPAIDAEFATLQGQESKLASLKTRWDFLKVALEDMNSASNNLTTASGRPFAPIMVDRHTRSLSDQWMAAKP